MFNIYTTETHLIVKQEGMPRLKIPLTEVNEFVHTIAYRTHRPIQGQDALRHKVSLLDEMLGMRRTDIFVQMQGTAVKLGWGNPNYTHDILRILRDYRDDLNELVED